MKLIEIKQPIKMIGWDIMETLNSKLENLVWEKHGESTIGIGFINEYEIQVKLDPIFYQNVQGVNLTFGVKHDDKFKETFQDDDNKDASKIFGGVVNAIREKINDYDWHFLCIIAKDNVQKRKSLYKAIIERIMRTIIPGTVLSMYTKNVNNTEIILLAKKNDDIDFDAVWKSFLEDNSL